MRWTAICLIVWASSLPTVALAQESTSKPPQTKAERIAALENYLATLYGKPLAEKNRLSKLVAVASLARVDSAPTTAKLMEALATPDPLVSQLAWEAVRDRESALSPADRDEWLTAGVKTAQIGGFPGVTVAPLLAALSTKPAASFKGLPDVMARVAAENDPATDDGKAALDAARDAIAAWRDPRLIQTLLTRVQKTPTLAPRVAEMLAGLPNPPDDTDDPKKFVATWSRYLRVSKLAPRPAAAPTTQSNSRVRLPAPEKIIDPADKKWRKDLELPRLDLDTVDLALCIDATASMLATNAYVTPYIETLMRTLHLMSDQVRGGAVYYRHETDERIMLPCCKDAVTQKDNFRTRTIEFTSDPKLLVANMRAQKLSGKTGHAKNRSAAGAYAGGIATAIQMRWSGKGKRIIACTGDDNATPGSEQTLLDLAKMAKDKDILLIFFVRDDTAAKSIAAASLAATGLPPIVYKSDFDKFKETPTTQKSDADAVAQFQGTAFETLTSRVVELSLPEGYRDRVPPLMSAMLPILQAQDAASKARLSIGR